MRPIAELSRIPVHIITGFLWAGKTTFLNHLIRSQMPERIVVIENEVGDTNIDGALVLDGADSVVELTAGCICCSLNEELYTVLEEIAARREHFDRLVIETTGIADPGSVVQTFLENLAIGDVFALKNVICLADARYFDEALRDTDEARRQIAAADVILLNKMDLLETTAEKERLFLALHGINPLAKTYTGAHGEFPVDEILALETLGDAGAVAQTEIVEADHKHLHHDITSFCLTFDRDFNLRELSHQMLVLLNAYRHQVYRVKGVISGEHQPVKVVLQSVRNMLGLSDGTPWQPDEPRQSKIVFIGKGVQRESIERIFRNCLAKPLPTKLTAETSMLRKTAPPQSADYQKIKFG
jgi:G3E family GTPase